MFAASHKPLCVVPWTPTTPVTQKRQRQDAKQAREALNSPGLFSMPTPSLVEDGAASITSSISYPSDPGGSVSFAPVSLPEHFDLGLQHSLEGLDAESHRIRLEMVATERSDKQTQSIYSRHLRNYEKFWLGYQTNTLAIHPGWTPIPAHPLTAAKVVLYLNHEFSREKKKRGSTGETVAGSSLGKEHFKQTISALESHRFNNQHLFRHIPDAQVPLRSDNRITVFESATKHNEPKRIEKAQALKAVGTSSDTYTPEELIRCSKWCLNTFTGHRNIFVGLRDRAMLLFSTTTAFRGESSRILLWSDLFRASVPIDDIKLGHEVPVLAALANNAKHNQTGRTDEHGALRHRDVNLCPVGAIGFLFFAYFHILCIETPAFAPDFTTPNYGEWGYRAWYSNYVFSTKTVTSQMSYDTHRERVTKIHEANGVSISKVTHAGRPFAAQTSRSHGASVTGTKALGGWNDSGSFRACYDRAFPLDALLGAATFNARKPELHSLPRDCLAPPPHMLAEIFPFVEAEQHALAERQKLNPKCTDIALRQFLDLLCWLRQVIIQDAALLFCENQHAAIFKFAPFNSDEFRIFAENSVAVISNAQAEARLALQNLPEQVAATFRGAMVEHALQMQRERDQSAVMIGRLKGEIVEMKSMIELVAGSSKRRKRFASASTVLPPASEMPAPTSPPLPPSPPSPTQTFTINFSTSSSGPVITATNTSPLVPLGDISSSSRVTVTPSDLHTSGTYPHVAPPFIPINTRESQWAALAQKFGDEQLRRHTPEWVDGDWLPRYLYQRVHRISDIWTEWAIGLAGYLPVRVLEETWGVKWRRNVQGQKTEGGRRKKVVNLVIELSNKPRWDTSLALRFLAARYEEKYSPRQFCDYLVRNRAAVVALADSFP